MQRLPKISILPLLPNTLNRSIFFICLSFILQVAKAGTPQGAIITYKYLDSLKYEVKLHYYRSCLDSALISPVNAYVQCVGGSVKIKLNMQWQSIKDITPTCTKEKKRCNPANNSMTGEGIEEHVFIGFVDFADTNFKSVSSCDAVFFFIDECCRSTAFTTGTFSGNLYNSAYLNRKLAEGNTSPQITLPPIFDLCLNQAFYHNIGLIDSFDFDSVSYMFSDPLGSSGSTWNNPFSYRRFISAYWLSPLKYPYVNVNANPPMGIYLDPETGDIIFLPTKKDEITVMVVRINEWRKDSTEKYQLIGSVNMDQMLFVKTCPDNYPPQITNSDFTYRTCEEQRLCFNVTTDDKVFNPPAPLPKPPPDTVRLSWSHGIPGASVQITNKGARNETAQFCWTPEKGTAKDIPYVFYAEARDNACPLNAITRRSFRIFVKHKAEAQSKIDKHSCGYYSVESKTINGFRGTPQYSWLILDEKKTIVSDSRIAYFKSTLAYLSNKQQDTIYFKKAGTYIVQHTINNIPNNCPTTYFETIVVSNNIPDLIALEDTFYCMGQPLTLVADLATSGNYSKPKWHTGNPSDTGIIAPIYFNQTQDSFILKFSIQDSLGCEVSDFLKIRKWDVATPALGRDTILCGNYIYKLKAPLQEPKDWFRIKYLWQDASVADTLEAKKGGSYWVQTTNACGATSDTVVVFDKTNLLKPTLPVHFCESDSVKINSQLKGLRYRWQTISKDTSFQIPVSQPGFYTCKVILKCGDTLTDNIVVVAEKVPELLLPDSAEFCEMTTIAITGGVWDEYTAILWNDTTSDSAKIISKPDFYWIRAQNLCGIFYDTILVTEKKLPMSDLGNDTVYCNQFNRTYNFAQRNDDYLWSDKSITPYFAISFPGKYWLTVSNYCGVSSDAIVVEQSAPPNLNLGNDTSIMVPFNLVLDAQNPGSKYFWNNGDTTRMIVVKNLGTYWVSVANACGIADDSINILEKVGIKNLKSNEVSIYPNPGKGILTIHGQNLGITPTFEVIDENGKSVPLNQETVQVGSEYQIVVLHMSPGVYILTWQHGETRFRKSFVVD